MESGEHDVRSEEETSFLEVKTMSGTEGIILELYLRRKSFDGCEVSGKTSLTKWRKWRIYSVVYYCR